MLQNSTLWEGSFSALEFECVKRAWLVRRVGSRAENFLKKREYLDGLEGKKV